MFANAVNHFGAEQMNESMLRGNCHPELGCSFNLVGSGEPKMLNPIRC